MKVVALAVLLIQVAFINASSYTIRYYGNEHCHDSVIVNQRTSNFGVCQNFYFDRQLSSETECIRSIQCLNSTDGSGFCDNVISLDAYDVYQDNYVAGIRMLRSEQSCETEEREELEFDIPFDTCLPSNYQGCHYMFTLNQPIIIETTNAANTLTGSSIVAGLFILFAGIMI